MVAIASRTPLGSAGRSTGARNAIGVTQGVFFLIFVAALGVMVVLLGWALWPSGYRYRHSKEPPRVPIKVETSWWSRLLLLALPLLVASGLIALAAAQGHRRAQPQPASVRNGRPFGRLQHRQTGEPGWLIAAGSVFVVALLGTGAALIVAERRPRRLATDDRARSRGERPPPTPDITEVVPSEPRAAVLFAYARMLVRLADAGVEPGAAEAPREYLRRSAPILGPALPAGERLTSLFEVARFSGHQVAVSDADTARDAFAQIENTEPLSRGVSA